MANAYGTIADGGKAKKWYVVSKVVNRQRRRRSTSAPKQTTRALSDRTRRDVSYALQQVVQDGTGANALALGRPAAGKTGTATNADGDVSSSWFVGYTPQLATAVMYVRGDGNDALNGYLPSYFGGRLPDPDLDRGACGGPSTAPPVQSFPPAANIPAKRDDHAPAPTYTPSPTPSPTRTASPTPSADADHHRAGSEQPTPAPTTSAPTPTQTPTPSPSSESRRGPPTSTIPPNPNGSPSGRGNARGGSPTPTP